MAKEFYASSDVVFGKDAVHKLSEILKAYKAKSVMVVYGSSVKRVGIAQKVLNEVEKAQVKITVFEGVIPNPTNEVVEEAAEIGRCNMIFVRNFKSKTPAFFSVKQCCKNRRRVEIWET